MMCQLILYAPQPKSFLPTPQSQSLKVRQAILLFHYQHHDSEEQDVQTNLMPMWPWNCQSERGSKNCFGREFEIVYLLLCLEDDVTPSEPFFIVSAGIYWDKLSPEKLGQIRILRELKSRIEGETGQKLPCGPSEKLPPTAKRKRWSVLCLFYTWMKTEAKNIYINYTHDMCNKEIVPFPNGYVCIGLGYNEWKNVCLSSGYEQKMEKHSLERGLEPLTLWLTATRSSQLSYSSCLLKLIIS